MTFKIGARVILNVNSNYYKDARSDNPRDVIGTVVDDIRDGDHLYEVKWDNDEYNYYRDEDLSSVESVKKVQVKKERPKATGKKVTLFYADGKHFHYTRVTGVVVDTRSGEVKIDSFKNIDEIAIRNNVSIPFSYLTAVFLKDDDKKKSFSFVFENGKVIESQETYAPDEIMSVKQL